MTRITTLTFLTLAALSRAPARAGTATTLPPVYRATDAIDEHPARLVGDDANLTIKNGWLTGRLERGAYRVQITPDRAVGTGPLGRVDVRIRRAGDAIDVSGIWNGGDVHVVLGPDRIEGRALKQISDEQRGYQSCRYELDRGAVSRHYTGLAECLGQQPLRMDVAPRLQADLRDEENAVLLVAYLAAPPAVWNP
jgi:hypothetical protein